MTEPLMDVARAEELREEFLRDLGSSPAVLSLTAFVALLEAERDELRAAAKAVFMDPLDLDAMLRLGKLLTDQEVPRVTDAERAEAQRVRENLEERGR